MITLPVKISRGRSGRPKAAWIGTPPESGELLTEWLETDIQDPESCDQILTQAGKILEARTGSWKTSGNAFSLLVGPRRALLTPLFGMRGTKPFRIPTAEMIAVIEAWKAVV